jgi:hypothetical protein
VRHALVSSTVSAISHQRHSLLADIRGDRPPSLTKTSRARRRAIETP